MKTWLALIAFIGSMFMQGFAFLLGGSRARNKAKLKGLENKVTKLEKDKEIENLSDDDVSARLDRWLRPDD